MYVSDTIIKRLKDNNVRFHADDNISNYISETIAKELIANNICFIDCVGNSYLKIESVFVMVLGKKMEIEKTYTKPKAFQSTGIKLLFALFINENL